MKWLAPYRLATYLLLLFFLGHTGGGMLAQQPMGAAADTVLAAMKTVHFDLNGSTVSWYGMWFGFGLTASIFLLLSAVMSWQLAKVDAQAWPQVQLIAWALVVAQAANTVLSWLYFFMVPGLFGVLITALLAVGAFSGGRRAAA
jgi:hypothetical protein